MGQPRIPMFSKVAPRIASGLRHQIASLTLLRPINRCFSAGSDMSQLQEVLNLREAMKTDTRKAMLIGNSWHLLETVEHLDFVIGSVSEVVDSLSGGLSLDGVPSGVLFNSLGDPC